ncbi:molybdenum ABC transporter ATP-binding protein [Candidatus Methylospira mobilis]|uniref:Molybdenum ABC transporter ATP-binding protein n=1 Tax=Candidatus Methylospira mobilis TaxID=1808979 RepID=A0A5Q0BHA2_9GAMM|nr:molybdenum ABC transporter ATP-binding protein [Candidatus Methylospira mobilis]QFY41508.1 molybdenum ABC transporter ATP-binding protein [Candidatus Methylospira mobilis]
MSTGNIQASFSVLREGFRLGVDLQVPGQGVTALFGHSGSGKTTVLRCIAGLERVPDGFLSVNGEIWQDDCKSIFLPTHRRPLGYVFQEASLFAHLSVRKNLEFGLKRVPQTSQKVAFDQALELLGIESLLERKPASLSGGERQRVGIARALLTSPRLLLLDEPLAALDKKRKDEIIPYLERLQNELSIPLIYVSHSMNEIAQLADFLVLLDHGSVIASGPLQETLARLDLHGSFADDAGVVLKTVVAAHEDADALTRLDFTGGSIYVAERPEPLGRSVRCRVHARDVSLTLEKPVATSILNLVSATVVGVGETDNPAHVLIHLNTCGSALLARITRRSLKSLGIAEGMTVWAQIKAVALLN